MNIHARGVDERLWRRLRAFAAFKKWSVGTVLSQAIANYLREWGF